MRFSLFATLLGTACAVAAQDVYDYIVVGSGPGGGPLASNLARTNYSVLLIEAGDESPNGNSMAYPPTVGCIVRCWWKELMKSVGGVGFLRQALCG